MVGYLLADARLVGVGQLRDQQLHLLVTGIGNLDGVRVLHLIVELAALAVYLSREPQLLGVEIMLHGYGRVGELYGTLHFLDLAVLVVLVLAVFQRSFALVVLAVVAVVVAVAGRAGGGETLIDTLQVLRLVV